MGICQSCSSKGSDDVLFCDGSFKVRNTKTGHILQQNTLQFTNPSEYAEQIACLHKRTNLNITKVPQLRTFYCQSSVCHGELNVTVAIEHLQARLSDLSFLNYEDAIYVVTNLLQIESILSKEYSFTFTAQKVGINNRGEIVLWINDNFFRSDPTSIEPSKSSNRERIISAVLHLNSDQALKVFINRLSKEVEGVQGRLQELVRLEKTDCSPRKVILVVQEEKDRLLRKFQEHSFSQSRQIDMQITVLQH